MEGIPLAKNKKKCFEKCFQNKANCQKIFQNNREYWGSFWKKLSVWAVDIEISQSQKSKVKTIITLVQIVRVQKGFPIIDILVQGVLQIVKGVRVLRWLQLVVWYPS